MARTEGNPHEQLQASPVGWQLAAGGGGRRREAEPSALGVGQVQSPKAQGKRATGLLRSCKLSKHAFFFFLKNC